MFLYIFNKYYLKKNILKNMKVQPIEFESEDTEGSDQSFENSFDDRLD
jgi:hypothetical protein